VRSSLKWPNDVLIGGGKVSGILIETAGSAVILGIGINVQRHPADLPYAVTSLHEHGAEAAVGRVRNALLVALSARLDQWERGGFAPVRADWLARGHPPGTRLRVRQPPLEGRFAGLDEDGALLLDTEAGRRRIVAGEVTPG
ncbi:MAG: biotin--[acetyl-CoA-carboxylase] ligase, partial [Acetobacteraceae bacterium]